MGMVGCEVLYDCEELVGVNHRRWCEWPYNGISFWRGCYLTSS